MDWLGILRTKRDELGSSELVGKMIGYKGSSVRLVLLGKYPGKTDKIAAAVLARLANRIVCPHLKSDITPDECNIFSGRAMPLSDPRALRHWRACSACPANSNLEAAE